MKKGLKRARVANARQGCYRDYFNQSDYVYVEENYNLQKRIITTSGTNNYYTSAGYDMIDRVNQRNLYGSAYPIDRVSGYTLKQLEGALKGARYWTQWRNHIKDRYENDTEKYLDELFSNWKV